MSGVKQWQNHSTDSHITLCGLSLLEMLKIFFLALLKHHSFIFWIITVLH